MTGLMFTTTAPTLTGTFCEFQASRLQRILGSHRCPVRVVETRIAFTPAGWILAFHIEPCLHVSSAALTTTTNNVRDELELSLLLPARALRINQTKNGVIVGYVVSQSQELQVDFDL